MIIFVPSPKGIVVLLGRRARRSRRSDGVIALYDNLRLSDQDSVIQESDNAVYPFGVYYDFRESGGQPHQVGIIDFFYMDNAGYLSGFYVIAQLIDAAHFVQSIIELRNLFRRREFGVYAD